MDYEAIQTMRASGWQHSDDAHPPGTGKPGYRLVFKTLKLVPHPGAALTWPNLRITFLIGKTNRGGIKVGGALDTRRPNFVLLPEYLDEIKTKKGTTIKGRTNMKFEFHAWEEEIDDSSVVEMLLITDATEPDEILQEGKLSLGKIKTIFDLTYGTRLLGIPLTEEVVEIFPDWHWNRNMSSISVGTESTLDIASLETREYFKLIQPAIELTQYMSEQDRQKLSLACDWYWKADGERDIKNRFVYYWISVEALEMPNSTNIKPVKDIVSEITGIDYHSISPVIGRLFSVRSKIVHGKPISTPSKELLLLHKVIRALLHHRLFPDSHSEIYDELEEMILKD